MPFPSASEEISISARARSLPRTLIYTPSPYLELHAKPCSSPEHKTPPVRNTVAPSWDSFTYHCPPHCGNLHLGFLLRDSAYPSNVLGMTQVLLNPACVSGWFPLQDTHNIALASQGELFLSCERPTRCLASMESCHGPKVETGHFEVEDYEVCRHNLRSVASETGYLFRCGEMVVSVKVTGLPVSTRDPNITLEMSDQNLRADEVAVGKPKGKGSNAIAEGKAVKKAGIKTGKKVGKSAKKRLGLGGGAERSVLSGAVSAVTNVFRNPDRLRTIPKDQTQAITTSSENSGTDGVAHEEDGKDDGADGEERHEDGTGSREESCDSDIEDESEVQGKQGAQEALSATEKKDIDSNSECDIVAPMRTTFTLSQSKPRRVANFGSFSFALFQGVYPKQVGFTLRDRGLHLPQGLTVLSEQTLELPNLEQFKCLCEKKCNSHLLEYRLCDPGPTNAKIVFDISILYKTWTPLAKSRDVTPRFREVMASIDESADSFKSQFPMAENLTYLLVGGLFTTHYPTYFKDNINFLQEKLRLPRVQTVPIHTEGNIARNAKIIRDSVLKTCRGANSIVLIGHSKGGLDAIAVLDSFPETIPFLYGIVSFQAPFGGTFLVDFVSRSKLAVSALTGVIETLWRGDSNALHDMSYSARSSSFGNVLESYTKPNTSSIISESGENSREPEGPSEAEWQEMIAKVVEKIEVYKKVPVVSFSSYACFDVSRIRSAANAAGVASMAPAAQKITQHTGFMCDGLVTSSDARIPYADSVLLEDMMHTEPALYVQGSRYPPGQLTATALALLFEKACKEVEA